GALVVRRIVPRRDPLVVLVVDAADVADHMRRDLTERILAEEPRLDVDAWKAIAIDREARDLLVGQLGADRQALEVLRFLEQLLEPLAVARLDADDLRQLVDRRVEIRDARRRDLERVRRVALREHDAVAVGDHAAIRHDRDDRDPVRLRERLEMRVLDDLQIEEAREQPAERDEDQSGDERQPAAEVMEVALGITELGGAEAAAVAPPRKEQTPGQTTPTLAAFAASLPPQGAPL